MILTTLLGRFWWQIPVALGALGIVLTWDSSRKAKWVETGKQEVRVEIKKANHEAVKLGTGAAAGAVDKRVRGRRDPTTRDD